MKRHFPELTALWLRTRDAILPESFLDGSARRLQRLWLCRTNFPTLPKLLLTASDLVRLELHKIPDSGYILPEEMATSLAALKRLKYLSSYSGPLDLMLTVQADILLRSRLLPFPLLPIFASTVIAT
jgi:hypothetical protein